MKNLTMILSGTFVLGVLIIVLVPIDIQNESSEPDNGPVAVIEDHLASKSSDGIAPAANQPDIPAQLAVAYLERYGESIAKTTTQARLYNEKRELLERYPERGNWYFEKAMALAFPALKDQILALIQGLEQYHAWLDQHELRLQGLTYLERQSELWRQRETIFGELAAQIWQNERNLVEEKSQAFQETLVRLDQASELQLPELAYQLQSRVDEIYGNDLGGQLVSTGALSHALFTMESVQSKLEALPQGRRQQAINNLRRRLGYPESAVARLAEEDRKREEKWRNGEAYMAERETLKQALSGQALTDALTRLQRDYFGQAAPTIAREEDEGFYRFERQRRYGLN